MAALAPTAIRPETPAERIAGLDVVVAEDNAFHQQILRTLLSGFGCRNLRFAEGGAEALDLIFKRQPDVLLLDLEMPAMDGFEVLKALRRPGHPACFLPVIVISGHANRGEILRAAQAGCHEFIRKPLSARILYERLRAAIAPRSFIQSPTFFGPAPRLSTPVDLID